MFCLQQSRRILLVAALAGVAALAASTFIEFDTDILNLVPEHNVEINEFREVIEELGTIDYHIVVVKVPEQAQAEQYEPLLEQLARQYEALPTIEQVDYRLPDPIAVIEEVLPDALLLLTPAEIDRVGARLTDEAIRESVARNRALLQTPQSTAVKQLVQYDPFNILPIFLDRFRSTGGGFEFDTSSGMYASPDGSTILLLTKPERAAQDIPFAREIMESSWRIERKVLDDFDREYPEVPSPEIVYTGGYAIAYDDAELIKSDVIANVLFSFFGVLFLFWYAFRRVAAIGYAGIPMALAIALTFGLAAIALGTLSAASAGFAALLAGLGIDFITVLYERYVEERNGGKPVPVALQNTIRSTMPGVVIAAVTTAATFYGFLVTDFRGMTELGFLTGTGILLFLLCVAFVLPSLIIETERNTTKVPRLHLHTFGSDRLMQLCMRKPRSTLVVWGVFLVIAGFFATTLTFSDDVANLRAKGNRGVLVQDYLTEKFGQSFDFMMLVADGATVEEVLERTEAVKGRLDQLVAERKIGAYQSISTFVPSMSQQREVIGKLRDGRSSRFDPDRIESALEDALEEQGFRSGVYDSYLAKFRQALTPEEPVTLDEIDNEYLQRLGERFLQPTSDGRWMSVMYLYPANGVWDREVPGELLDMGSSSPHLTLTGVNLVSAVLRTIVRDDAIRSTSLGFVMVLVLLSIGFRSVRRALLIFVPFLAGCVGMLGLMALLGLSFNFMNVFVGLMLVGVGTDY
ncbi:MAG: MMPL family transporter, partial [Acidobacteria bacterium]|nr:MMPL family transporter [Acidobacteriota bacterium]